MMRGRESGWSGALVLAYRITVIRFRGIEILAFVHRALNMLDLDHVAP